MRLAQVWIPVWQVWRDPETWHTLLAMHAAKAVEQLRGEARAGRLSRNEMLEELERHIQRSEGTLEGALDVVLEELHETPSDSHLLRLLAQLQEKDGDAAGAARTLSFTEHNEDLEGAPEISIRDQLIRARVFLEARMLTEAEATGLSALEREPRSLAALNLLAKVYHVQERLTQMIWTWHQIQSLTPHREDALAYLEYLYRLSADEEQLGKRVVEVGNGFFAKKDEVQLSLEGAFRNFREQDFDAAVADAENLAARFEHPHPAHKIAFLLQAWILERIGDVAEARSTLELMGRTRGYETDIDRLGFLARVYERINTPEALDKAVMIYEHLDRRHGRLTALLRLAQLNSARGRDDDAKRYADEYERRFHTRMQKPTPAEKMLALEQHYIPLARLASQELLPAEHEECEREIRFAQTVASRRRRRILFAWLSGDLSRAERLSRRLVQSRLSQANDWAIRGDLLALLDSPGAHECHCSAIREGLTTDATLWSRVLAGDCDELFRTLSSAALAESHEALRNYAMARPMESEPWRILGNFECAQHLDEAGLAHRGKAEALDEARRTSDATRGRVLVAAVYSLNGKPKGVIHEVVARRWAEVPSNEIRLEVLGNVTDELRANLRLLLDNVIDYAIEVWPHLANDARAFAYSFKISKNDEPSSGNSMGLPAALAFLACILEKPVPNTIASTGAVFADSSRELMVRRVGDTVYKVKGAYHRDLEKIIVPGENRADVEHGDIVPTRVAAAIVNYVVNFDRAIEAVWGVQAWHW